MHGSQARAPTARSCRSFQNRRRNEFARMIVQTKMILYDVRTDYELAQPVDDGPRCAVARGTDFVLKEYPRQVEETHPESED